MKRPSFKVPVVGPDGFTRGGTVWIQSGFDPTDIDTYDGIAIDPDGETLGAEYIGLSVWEDAEMRVLINSAGILIKGGNSAWIPNDYDVEAPAGLVINNNGGADDGITIWETPIATPIKRLQLNGDGLMVYGGYAAFVPEDYDPDDLQGVLIEASTGMSIYDDDRIRLVFGTRNIGGTDYTGIAGFYYDPLDPLVPIPSFFITSDGDFSFGSDTDSQFSFIAASATLRIGPAVTILATEGDAAAGVVADKTTLGLSATGRITKPVNTSGITCGWHGAWDSGHAYVIGDSVSSSGHNYVAILGGTNHTPASSPTYWTEATTNPTDGMIIDSEGLRWYASSVEKFKLDNAGNGIFSGKLEGATISSGSNLVFDANPTNYSLIEFEDAAAISVLLAESPDTAYMFVESYTAGLGSLSLGTASKRWGNIYLEPEANTHLVRGNLVLDTADCGIDFSANANSGAMSSELFNDYEIGTWTPSIKFAGANVSMTFSVALGRYEKIGKRVHVTAAMAMSAKGSSTGAATISGLPFACVNDTGGLSAVSLRLLTVTFANQYQGYVNKNTYTIVLEEITEAGAMTALTDADFANNSQIVVTASYEAI